MQHVKVHFSTCWHTPGSQALYGSYTESVWPIHINDLNCTGSEESVWECPHNGIVGYSCNHRQDASVVCQGESLRACTTKLTSCYLFST